MRWVASVQNLILDTSITGCVTGCIGVAADAGTSSASSGPAHDQQEQDILNSNGEGSRGANLQLEANVLVISTITLSLLPRAGLCMVSTTVSLTNSYESSSIRTTLLQSNARGINDDEKMGEPKNTQAEQPKLIG
jgi:hypothetical protein